MVVSRFYGDPSSPFLQKRSTAKVDGAVKFEYSLLALFLLKMATSHSPTGQTVAIIGAGKCHGALREMRRRLEAKHNHLGPTGLSMLKTLRADGFDATIFERRSQVGGVWSYTEDETMTTALPSMSSPSRIREMTDRCHQIPQRISASIPAASQTTLCPIVRFLPYAPPGLLWLSPPLI